MSDSEHPEIPPQVNPEQALETDFSQQPPLLPLGPQSPGLSSSAGFKAISEALENPIMSLGILIGVGLLCSVGNLTLPRLWWDSPGPNEPFYMSTLMIALGCLSAEFGALGVWFGAGKQNVFLRMLLSTTIAFMLSALYVVGLVVIDSGIPLWAVFLIIGIGVVGQVIVGCVLLGVSTVLKLKIGHRRTNSTSSNVRASDIRTIAIVTAIVAVIITICRALVSVVGSQNGGGGPSAGEFTDVILMLIQGAFICAIILGSLLLLLLYDNYYALLGIFGLAVVVVVIIPINLAIIHFAYRTLDVDSYFVLFYYSFMLGFSGLTGFFCLLGRLTGFRLVEA